MAFKAIVAIVALCALSSANVLRDAEVEAESTFSTQIELNVNEISTEVKAAIDYLNQNGLNIQRQVANAYAALPKDQTSPAQKLDTFLDELKKQLKSVNQKAFDAVQKIQDDLNNRLQAIKDSIEARHAALEAQTAQLREEHDQDAEAKRKQLENESEELRLQLEQQLAARAAALEEAVADGAEQLKTEAADLFTQLDQYSGDRHNDLAALKDNINNQIKSAADKTQQRIRTVRNFALSGLLQIDFTVSNYVVFKVNGDRSVVNSAVTKLSSGLNAGQFDDQIAALIQKEQGKTLKLRDVLKALATTASNKDQAALLDSILTRLSTFVSTSGSPINDDFNVTITVPRQ